LLWPGTGAVLEGLFVPRIPDVPGEPIVWTVALIGGLGGTLTVLCYGYWLREDGRTAPEDLRLCRIDIGLSYAVTALFGIAMMIVGSNVHIGMERFIQLSGAKLLLVPDKGSAPSIIAVMGGEIHMAAASSIAASTALRTGKVRELASMGPTRIPALPDLPTVAEAGVPGYDTSAWYGLVMPTGTPKQIIALVNAQTIKVMKLPDVKARLDATGMVPSTSSPEELGQKIRAEITKWAKVVNALSLTAD
jgi:hypothetical protein